MQQLQQHNILMHTKRVFGIALAGAADIKIPFFVFLDHHFKSFAFIFQFGINPFVFGFNDIASGAAQIIFSGLEIGLCR